MLMLVSAEILWVPESQFWECVPSTWRIENPYRTLPPNPFKLSLKHYTGITSLNIFGEKKQFNTQSCCTFLIFPTHLCPYFSVSHLFIPTVTRQPSLGCHCKYVWGNGKYAWTPGNNWRQKISNEYKYLRYEVCWKHKSHSFIKVIPCKNTKKKDLCLRRQLEVEWVPLRGFVCVLLC